MSAIACGFPFTLKVLNLGGTWFCDWKKNAFAGIQFRNFNKNKKCKSQWVFIFLLLLNVIVIKYVKETLISLL